MEYDRRKLLELARSVREECINVAKEGYKDASMSGLCAEGAFEAAVGSMQSLDLEHLVQLTGK